MSYEELERRVAQLRARPLLVLCLTPDGEERVMTLEQCRRTGSAYIHIAADELDRLLGRELGR